MLRYLLIPLLFATAVRGEVTFTSLFREMTVRTVVTHWPAVEYQSLQASSYNRAAKTPDDPNGWFANSDCGFEICKETTAGRTECVLMEHHGPGVLTRIWTTFFQDGFDNCKGTDIRIYVDGETEPRFQGNMIELLTGNGPVKPPFAQATVRAGCLYLPIPFAKSIKDEGDYEITFTYQSGGHRLEIEWVALTVNGNEIMRDTHLAWAGDPVKDNTFRLNPGAIVFNGKYEIRAKVRTDGGNEPNGKITLRKKQP